MELGEERLFNAVPSEALLAYIYGYSAHSFFAGLPPKGLPLKSSYIWEMGAYHKELVGYQLKPIHYELVWKSAGEQRASGWHAT